MARIGIVGWALAHRSAATSSAGQGPPYGSQDESERHRPRLLRRPRHQLLRAVPAGARLGRAHRVRRYRRRRCRGARASSSSARPNSASPAHVTVDGGPAIWDGFVKPFVWAGEGYQGQYPLLVSDRYLIVDAALARANDLGTNAIAHGCTGMGNDQVRFDLAVKACGDYRDRRADPRNPEGTHPDARLRAGVPRGARLRRARQAEGLHHQREPARA